MLFHLRTLPPHYFMFLWHQGHASSCCRCLVTFSKSAFALIVNNYPDTVSLTVFAVFSPLGSRVGFFLFTLALMKRESSRIILAYRKSAGLLLILPSIHPETSQVLLSDLLLLTAIQSPHFLVNSDSGVLKPDPGAPESLPCESLPSSTFSGVKMVVWKLSMVGMFTPQESPHLNQGFKNIWKIRCWAFTRLLWIVDIYLLLFC